MGRGSAGSSQGRRWRSFPSTGSAIRRSSRSYVAPGERRCESAPILGHLDCNYWGISVALVGGSRPVVGLEREAIAELTDLFERHKADVGVLKLLGKELRRRPGDAVVGSRSTSHPGHRSRSRLGRCVWADRSIAAPTARLLTYSKRISGKIAHDNSKSMRHLDRVEFL